MARHILIILTETNVPFYVVSLYVAIFRNVTSVLMQTYSMNMSALPVIISKLLLNLSISSSSSSRSRVSGSNIIPNDM